MPRKRLCLRHRRRVRFYCGPGCMASLRFSASVSGRLMIAAAEKEIDSPLPNVEQNGIVGMETDGIET